MAHLLLAVAVILPAICARLLLRMAGRLPTSTLALLFFLSGLLQALPLVVVLHFDWVSRIYTGTSDLMGLLLLLGPAACAVLLYQRALYQAVGQSGGELTFKEYLSAKARTGTLGALPLVVTLLVLLTLVRTFPDLAWGPAAVASIAGATLAVVFALYPYLFKRVMRGQRLAEPALRQVLLDLARRAGVAIADIVIIPTGKLRVPNAWVAGVLPQHRIVFLSDALVARMTTPELEAVFAHELGHVRKHHLWAYLAYATGATLLFALLGGALGHLLPGHPALVPVRGAVTGLITVLGFTFLSRRLELSADRYGATLTGNPQAAASALAKLAAARGLNPGSAGGGPLAVLQTHPPLEQRIRQLLGTRQS